MEGYPPSTPLALRPSHRLPAIEAPRGDRVAGDLADEGHAGEEGEEAKFEFEPVRAATELNEHHCVPQVMFRRP